MILSLSLSTSCGKKEVSKVEIEKDLKKEIEETWKEIELLESQNGENVAELTVRGYIYRALESLADKNYEEANIYSKGAKRGYKIYEKQVKTRKGRLFRPFNELYFNELEKAIIKHPNHKEKLTEFVKLQTKEKL